MSDDSLSRLDTLIDDPAKLTNDDLGWIDDNIRKLQFLRSRLVGPWENDDIQFPRLLDEIAAIGLSDDQLEEICESMDVGRDSINELFTRAERKWDALKANRHAACRTQSGVDALWPKDKQGYVLVGLVRTSATSVKNLRDLLQRLYEGAGSEVAGRFEIVEGPTSESGTADFVYQVEFHRDCSDDSEVVNKELLDGWDFRQTLRDQLDKEFTAARDATGSELLLSLEIIAGPIFY